MRQKTEILRGIRLDIKADAQTGEIEGYGSVFGVKDLGDDIVAAGAFADSLSSGRMPKMLWQHDASDPVGIWDEATEDNNGLRLRGRILTETSRGRDAFAFARAKVIDGLSIGFRAQEYDMDSKSGVRTITKAQLWEVSLVTFPMNESARIDAVKSAEEIDAMTETEIEKCLREADGFSRAEAKRIVHRLMSIGAQREADALKDARDALQVQALLRKIRS